MGVTPDTGESPAELIRNAATILATAGSYGRIAQFDNADIFAARELMMRAVVMLEPASDVTLTFSLTPKGRNALARSVSDRGPIALARHEGRRL